ncbi:MAG: transcription-repair coupling factor [Bacteroidetes bacterium]|nr:transcription-repair coupling factor [Bacteroidota bacterium]
MIEEIRKIIKDSGPFRQLIDSAKSASSQASIQLQGISGSLMAFTAVSLFESQKKQLLLIVPDKNRAEELRDDCSLLINESSVHLFTAGPVHNAAKLLDMSSAIAQVETLRSLSRSDHVLIIASAEGLTARLPDPKKFLESSIELEVNKEYPFEQFIQKLVSLGFEKKDFVEEYGDFAVRGGILDVFPFVGDNPIRFEFWGDTIESIREFDVLSQRSIRELQIASIVAGLSFESESENSSPISLFDYLSSDALLVFDELLMIGKEIDELLQEGYSGIFDWPALEDKAREFARYEHSAITASAVQESIDFKSHSQPAIGGSIKRLIEHINRFSNSGSNVYLACDTKDEGERITELIEEEITSPANQVSEIQQQDIAYTADQEIEQSSEIFSSMPAVQYKLLPEALHSGFVFPAAKIAVLTEHEIFGRLKSRGTAGRKKFKGFTQKELLQLNRGDFVVHQDFGIGRFAGLQKIKIRGAEAEVMKLAYEDNDTLYVHLNFINRVQKYSSQEGHTPKLNKLGSSDWERIKTRALKKIKDIARDLIKLYARRKHEKGFAFAPDTHWQKEMEASFLYEDTPDQASSTRDVKKDMEQESPMDRLICGDVGFGKTEVAVRAAFKAVMNGKQTAVLVPTTILAQQHFNTFLDRIGRYSVRVESLTRFRGKKEQAVVLQGLKDGKVDILIGTHRLLSKDVVFKDLGLLIIDEEQRFGVSAKEKLRQLRANVDTLTLTATPIPRTLQFSLMGARDLSLINTPPRNRIPIQTEIAQLDPQLVREAILKEIHRGGQVYFVHDRVQNIGMIQAMLEEHLPKVRFHAAHGQMKGHELEKAMMDFLEKKFDVLICTKIIESGIDIPSVNTIIINRADRFGLAELYQLRGRVGRSNIQAYAYLLTPPLSVLPKITLRRLQAIQEFTELGSGFNLAMRDLEIRGAGNLLGGEQSGFILEMGFEMYQRIVEEAVAELKDEEFKDLVGAEKGEGKRKSAETIIETDIEALIPDIYIEHDSERLDIYRRLYRCVSHEEVYTMRTELQDRFGEYPEEVEHLFRLVELKLKASKVGFIKVELTGEQLLLHFPSPEENEFYDGEDSRFQKIAARMHELTQFNPRLKQDGKQLKLIARIKQEGEPKDRIAQINTFLQMLEQ